MIRNIKSGVDLLIVVMVATCVLTACGSEREHYGETEVVNYNGDYELFSVTPSISDLSGDDSADNYANYCNKLMPSKVSLAVQDYAYNFTFWQYNEGSAYEITITAEEGSFDGVGQLRGYISYHPTPYETVCSNAALSVFVCETEGNAAPEFMKNGASVDNCVFSQGTWSRHCDVFACDSDSTLTIYCNSPENNNVGCEATLKL